MIARLLCVALFGTVILPGVAASGGQWSIPLAGNVFRVSLTDAPGRDADRQVVFFRLDRPATVRLSLRGRARQATAGVVVSAGERTFTATFNGPEPATHELGELDVKQAGYVRVELARSDNEAAADADVARRSI